MTIVTRPSSLILYTFAVFIRPQGGFAPISQLIRVMSALDLEAPAVRAAVSRLKARGLLDSARQAGQAGYQLTREATAILEEGDRRLWTRPVPARLSDGWVLVVFSIPEAERPLRHQLRLRLTWLGFGTLAPAVWIAPSHMTEPLVTSLRQAQLERYVELFQARHFGFSEVRDIVTRAWDLPRLRDLYLGLLAEVDRIDRRWAQGPQSNRQALADYMALVSQWRRLPFLEPGLPAELLPPDWPANEATERFFKAIRRLEPRAREFVTED